MVCELKILHGLKKIVSKFHDDPTLRLRVISEKQCYAAMKYIVVCIISNVYIDVHIYEYTLVT